MTAKIADLLPPNARRVVYAVLGFASAITPTVVAVLADGWQWSQDFPILLSSLAPAAGFTLAYGNVKD